MKLAACRRLIIYRYNACMNTLEILAQLSKITSISCSMVFGGISADQLFHMKPNLFNNIEGYGMVRIPLQAEAWPWGKRGSPRNVSLATPLIGR